MTRNNFILIFKNSDPKIINNHLKKLGYDKNLYCNKSKIFTLSFHTKAELSIEIGDAIKTELNKKAWDLMMEYYIKSQKNITSENLDLVSIVTKRSKKTNAYSFAAINKTDEEVEVELDLTKSSGLLFTPTKGKSTVNVPPTSIVYIASAIPDPDSEDYSLEFDVNEETLLFC